jgi:hypothetical protein
MELKVKLYGQRGAVDIEAEHSPPNTPGAPPELLRQKDWLFPQIAVFMRTYSIAHFEVTIEPSGVIPISTVGFRPLDDGHLPPALKTIRPDIVRMLKLLFERWCINSITISLSDKERDELRVYWQFLATGETTDADNAKYAGTPLHFDTDPTNATVADTPAGERDELPTRTTESTKIDANQNTKIDANQNTTDKAAKGTEVCLQPPIFELQY